MTTLAIDAHGLTKRFGERVAFENITFQVEQGEVFGFLGPNGAGKTTTVRVLGTMISPSQGTAEVAGVPLQRAAELRSRISILPERPGLFLKLSLYENLEYFAGLYGYAGQEVRRRIMSALETVGLDGRAPDIAGSLSKGLQQRAALARSMLNEPQVVFLDEPTQGLDASAARHVRELIEGLPRRGIAVFLTTHRLEEAERMCDRVAIVNTTLRSVGRPSELRRQLFGASVEVQLSAPLASPDQLFDSLPGVRGWRADGEARYLVQVDDARASAPELARALIAHGADLVRLAETERTLEDVYLRLLEDAP